MAEPLNEIDTLIDRIREERTSDPRRGLALIEEADRRLEEMTCREDARAIRAARLVTERGIIHHHLGNFPESLRHARWGLDLSRRCDLHEEVGDNLIMIGWAHLRTANRVEALKAFVEARQHAMEHNLPILETRLLNAMCALHYEMKNYEQSLDVGEQAIRHLRDRGQTYGEAAVKNTMAYALMECGELDRALELTEESIALQTDGEGPHPSPANQHDTQGEIYFRKQDFDRALGLFRRAHGEFSRNGDRQGELVALRNLGKTRVAMGEVDAGIADLDAALLIARSLNSDVESATCHQRLFEAHKLAGHPSRALLHHEEFRNLEKKVSDDLTERQLQALRVDHEVETARQQSEIHRLRTVELEQTVRELKQTKEILEARMRDLRSLHETVKELSIRDGLTGVHNRRYLDGRLEDASYQARRYQRPLSVALLDLDDFKLVNDRHSHKVGDEVLARVAAILVESVRTSDCVARYGGEEFALVLTETPLATARQAVERIRARVEEENWGAIASGLTVTLSLGVAELRDGEHHEALLHRADELLYVAKRRGKNRVVAQRD